MRNFENFPLHAVKTPLFSNSQNRHKGVFGTNGFFFLITLICFMIPAKYHKKGISKKKVS